MIISVTNIIVSANICLIIFAANCICHIPDLTDLIKSVDLMLTSKGVFIFEEPYLGSMFEKISYDQIYDEHIYMFSVSSVQKIFSRFDMELICFIGFDGILTNFRRILRILLISRRILRISRILWDSFGFLRIP